MPLLIRNGEIVTADSRFVADIFCQGETITSIGGQLPAPPDTQIIDATGHYVFPGFIDPHVHIHLPFMGTFAKDTHASASRAALCGGTTTFLEMICPSRSDDPWTAYETWRSKAEGTSACDYSFHMGVTRFDENTEGTLRRIVADGVRSFKVFLAYEGAFGVCDRELYRTLALAKELGIIVTAHCENAVLVSELQQALRSRGKTGPEWHEPSRPPRVEAEGVHHLATFAELTGARVYVVHLSCEEALSEALAARSRGVDISIETLIQYLLLDRTYAELPHFEGAKYVMSPPLRERRHQASLWNAIRNGEIQTVATDHAPFDFFGQKSLGKDDFTQIPNGIPSLEDRVNLLFHHGVRTGLLDLHRFVDLLSTQAAKLFDLFPRKGTIQVGADADLVVYDPNAKHVISAQSHHLAVDYSAFEGWPIAGRPAAVMVRGQIQVRDGEFVGDPSWGRFLRR